MFPFTFMDNPCIVKDNCVFILEVYVNITLYDWDNNPYVVPITWFHDLQILWHNESRKTFHNTFVQVSNSPALFGCVVSIKSSNRAYTSTLKVEALIQKSKVAKLLE
jgi:hypothetical protein